MDNKVKDLIKKLDEKKLSQVDISGVLMFADNNEMIINELIKITDSSKKEGHNLQNELLELIHELHQKYNISLDDDDEDEKIDEDDNEPTSVHTVVYRKENQKDSTLHVLYNVSDLGDLRMLGPTSSINFIDCSISLAYMDLKELEKDTRESFEKIDLYKYEESDKMIYSFKKSINLFENDIDDYSHIIIWSNQVNTNGYLLPYYFINRFYKKLLNKKIILVFTDALKGCRGLFDLKNGQFDELMKTAILLSKEDMEDYSSKWNEIVSHECEIRELVNGKLEYKNAEDYYDRIISRLKDKKEVVRNKFIGDLLSDNVIAGGIPDIYNYIIDQMIKKGILNSREYKVPNYIPADIISLSNK